MAVSSDDDSRSASKKSKTYASKQKKKEATPPSDDEEEQQQEAEEEVYDIEAILDAKKGVFKPGQWAFLVKWLNYSSEENSWVKEDDFGDADMITKFWEKHPEVKGNPLTAPTKRGRKSDASAKGGSSVSKAKPRKSKVDDSDDGMEVDEEEERPKKKTKPARKSSTPPPPRKSNGAKREVEESEQETEEDLTKAHAQNVMERYKNLKSWESIVTDIDTVEKGEDDEVMVYFTTKDSEKAISNSREFRNKAPQKLIDFYEGHLRWRPNQDQQ